MNEYLSIYKDVILKKYAQFSGRASREEYWTFTLITTAIYFIFYAFIIIGATIKLDTITVLLVILFLLISLALLLPSLAITIRRLHDIGKSGYYFFIHFIPIIGPIVLIIFMLTNGQAITNQWGPDPYEN